MVEINLVTLTIYALALLAVGYIIYRIYKSK